MALELARRGPRLLLTGCSEPNLAEVSAEVKAVEAEVEVLALDLTSYGAAEAMVGGALPQFERIDNLVNNAGVSAKETTLD